MLFETSIADYIARTSSDTQTPGGGAVLAVVASEGAALVLMQASFSKKEMEKCEQVLDSSIKLKKLAEDLKKLPDEDMSAFEELMKNLKTNRSKLRKEKLQECYKNCAEVPLGLMEKSLMAMETALPIISNGNPNLKSDGIIGIELLHTSIKLSRLNAEVNLKYIKDRAYVENKENEIKDIQTKAAEIIKQLQAQN